MKEAKIAIIGLGKMGQAVAHRFLLQGIKVLGYDIDEHCRLEAEEKGVETYQNFSQIARQTKIFWLMVPPGKAVDSVIDQIKNVIRKKTIVIDGGNSKFTDSIERAKQLEKSDIKFLDCGTSGGIRAQYTGFSLMIGGNFNVYKQIEPIFKAISAPNGYVHVGPSGAGHYVKMVHNGIEYALMQAYAEGFHLLRKGHFKNLDLKNIASVWQHGAVIRSWILELLYEILLEKEDFSDISGFVKESGMGKWTVENAHLHDIPVQLIEDAVEIRFWSQKTGGNYATKLVALLRNKFGGHQYRKE